MLASSAIQRIADFGVQRSTLSWSNFSSLLGIEFKLSCAKVNLEGISSLPLHFQL